MEQPEPEALDDTLHISLDETELEEAIAARHRFSSVAWENYVRCFFLIVVVSLVGYLAWKPGVLRFSILMSLANPSRGESLAWRPEPDPPPPPEERKRLRPPAEWRLGPGYSAKWNGARSASKNASLGVADISSRHWPRLSANPWNWRDDAASSRKRGKPDETTGQPPQKPASPFRAGELAAWPESQPERPAIAATSPIPSLPVQIESLPGESLPPLLPPALSTQSSAGQGLDSLAPLQLPALGTPGQTTTASIAPPIDQIRPPASMAVAPLAPLPGTDQSAAVQPPSQPSQPEAIDWKNREITGPIPDAYLTIYPKLKFVGLCVPGQGYIRKYNQIGVPEDLTSPKLSARDGRTPYGRYYIADRHRDADGPQLYLSWPSPEDAQRIGLDAGKVAEIMHAWRRQGLPPQDTAAGGGVGLNGLRNWVEVTQGGFALEAPAMEEIFTALPDRAWVFIQP